MGEIKMNKVKGLDLYNEIDENQLQEINGGFVVTATLIIGGSIFKKVGATKVFKGAVAGAAASETVAILNRVFP